MAIEYIIGDTHLPRYRAWKRQIRKEIGNRRDTIQQAISDKSFRRLVDSTFRPMFICGMAGSGTTLLSALIEQDYMLEMTLRESDRHPKAHSLLWLDKTAAYKDLESYQAAINSNSALQIRRTRKAKLILYRRLASYPREKGIILDKAPNSHLVRIGCLMGAFPSSLAILIYRDPVEVIEGLQRKWPLPFGASSIEDLADFWISLHQQFLQTSQKYQSRQMVFSYGDLVENSSSIVSMIAKKIDLKEREQPNNLKDKQNVPGKGLRNVVEGRVKIVKDAGRRSRKRMSMRDISIIEQVCGDLLQELDDSRTMIG